MNKENKIPKEAENNLYEKESKAEKLILKIFLLCFILLSSGLGILSLAAKDVSFSASENRVLTQFPSISFASLIDGSFMTEFENWLTDQFPFRDEAISLKTLFDRSIGKKEENGIYIGKNGYLFQKTSEIQEEVLREKTDTVNTFFENYADSEHIFMIIPDSSLIYSEYLPYESDASSKQEKIIKDIYSELHGKNLTVADVVTLLKEAKNDGKELYYKTDHHWTTYSAYKVYEYLAKQWKFTEDTELSEYCLTNDFEGTLASKSGVHESKDSIYAYIPAESEGSYTVNFEDEQKKSATLFNSEKLNEKNKYEVFLGGNYGKVSIQTDSDSENTLLIIKDSYANCLIPMLTPHFSQIVIIDPRYMSESLEGVMLEYDFTHTLFLYSYNTFLEDTSLTDVLDF